ncbi:hypothetical protein GCM10027446_27030 [Angustibacter peucedani]
MLGLDGGLDGAGVRACAAASTTSPPGAGQGAAPHRPTMVAPDAAPGLPAVASEDLAAVPTDASDAGRGPAAVKN